MAYAAYKYEIPGYPSGITQSPPVQDMEIAGAVDGEIIARNIVVLEGGSVKGMVGAESIVIQGIVEGVILAPNIELLATARVEGELHYENLKVAPGAHLMARCIPTES